MPGRQLSPHQQVVHRNRFFVLVPSVILIVLLAVLGWEIIRDNMSAEAKAQMPWKISLVGISPAASLSGVFAGLLLARGQFARSVRPAIGWTGAWEKAAVGRHAATDDDQTWVVKVYNGGAGLGVVRETLYRVVTASAGGHDPVDDWITLDEARDRLGAAGLTPGKGVSVIQLGVGHPLVSSTKPKDGYEIFKLNESVLPQLAALDMRIAVLDIVGDRHERYMQLLKGAEDELTPSRNAVIGQGDAQT
jgi:hypothetical protein